MMEFLYSWLGFLVFWFVVVTGAVVAIGTAGWAVLEMWVKLPWTVVRADQYARDHLTRIHVDEAARWFSAYEDLDPLWEHLQGAWRPIDEVRARVAAIRGTDVYNKPLEAKQEEGGIW